MNNIEMVAGTVGLAAAIVAEPVKRQLSQLGFLPADLEGARDAHTVAFLRSLDLDAAEILGDAAVARAEAYDRAQAGAGVRGSRRGSILSQSRLATA